MRHATVVTEFDNRHNFSKYDSAVHLRVNRQLHNVVGKSLKRRWQHLFYTNQTLILGIIFRYKFTDVSTFHDETADRPLDRGIQKESVPVLLR
jgi:hypothetical protein